MPSEFVLPTNGLHYDIDEVQYHADAMSLSSTSAKTLITKGPDVFHRKSLEAPEYKDAYDFGSVVHALVLGVGDFEVLFFDSYRTKKAKEARDEARAGGRAPILYKKYLVAEAMRAAVMANEQAAELLSSGAAEVSMWGDDPETGVLMRGRMDWLRSDSFWDLKTTGQPADQPNFLRTVWDYGYGFQAAYYRKILKLNGLTRGAGWIAVEKNEPHGTGVYAPDEGMMAQCAVDVDRALALYAYCKATDTWPTLEESWKIPGVGAPGLLSSLPYVESVTPA